MNTTVRRRRSALYVPASHERALDKARTLPCDVVIIDLEDAVAPEAKEAARGQALAALHGAENSAARRPSVTLARFGRDVLR